MSRIARRLGGRATRRRRHRRFAVVALLLVAVGAILVVAGSGEDDDDPVTTGTSLPDDPVERICLDNAAEIDTARSALLSDNAAEGAVEGFLQDAFVDLARDRSDAIRGLRPAPDPEVLAVLGEFDAVVDAVEADPSIGIGANPFAEVDDRWRALGLGGCAMSGGTVAGDG